MITADTITDEQIRELREQAARWLDQNPASAIGDRIRLDDWSAQHSTFTSAQIALGEKRPRRGSTKRAARARCAEILNARQNGGRP